MSQLTPAQASPDVVAQAFRRGAMACFIIAVLPIGLGIALLAMGVRMPLIGQLGPFLWALALIGVGFGLLKQSMAGVWGGILLCVAGAVGLLGYALFGGARNKAGVIVPMALLLIAVPRLWRLRQMRLASRR